MTIYSGFSHKTWWFSIVMLNYQRVRPWEPRLRCGLSSSVHSALWLWPSVGNPPPIVLGPWSSHWRGWGCLKTWFWGHQTAHWFVTGVVLVCDFFLRKSYSISVTGEEKGTSVRQCELRTLELLVNGSACTKRTKVMGILQCTSMYYDGALVVVSKLPRA